MYLRRFMAHYVYTKQEMEDCPKTHIKPNKFVDYLALLTIRTVKKLPQNFYFL